MTHSQLRTMWVILCGLLVTSLGCELVASVDRSAIPPPKQSVKFTNVSSSSGSGGFGGMAGMGGIGGMGGSGGIVQAGSGGMGGSAGGGGADGGP